MAIGLDTGAESVVNIKVIGVGGGGCNAGAGALALLALFLSHVNHPQDSRLESPLNVIILFVARRRS